MMEIYEKLKDLSTKKALLVGLGNEMRGDDGAGIYLVKEFSRDFFFPNWRFQIVGSSPENFLNKFCEEELIVFVDACHHGGKIGEIKFINPQELKGCGFTHSFSPLIFEYLQKKGKKVMLLGIQPKTTEFGKGLSKEVKKEMDSFLKGLKKCMNSR